MLFWDFFSIFCRACNRVGFLFREFHSPKPIYDESIFYLFKIYQIDVICRLDPWMYDAIDVGSKRRKLRAVRLTKAMWIPPSLSSILVFNLLILINPAQHAHNTCSQFIVNAILISENSFNGNVLTHICIKSSIANLLFQTVLWIELSHIIWDELCLDFPGNSNPISTDKLNLNVIHIYFSAGALFNKCCCSVLFFYSDVLHASNALNCLVNAFFFWLCVRTIEWACCSDFFQTHKLNKWIIIKCGEWNISEWNAVISKRCMYSRRAYSITT